MGYRVTRIRVRIWFRVRVRVRVGARVRVRFRAGDAATERAPAEESRRCRGKTVSGGTARVTSGSDHETDRGAGRRPPAEATGMVVHRRAVKRRLRRGGGGAVLGGIGAGGA